MVKIKRISDLTIKVVLFISIGVLVLVPACSLDGGTINPSPSQSSSGLVEKLTLDDLATRANLVVLGEVIDVMYQKEANDNIYTLVTLSIEQTFKGEAKKGVVISIPGGKLDGKVLEVEDASNFQLGEGTIVFLEKGDEIFRVVGGFQGKFTIDKNNMVGNVPLQRFVEQVNNAVAEQ